MIQAFIHGFILAFGLILPLGVQNVFVFNQGAVHKRFLNALPVVVTASICDTLLILLAVLGVSVLVLGSFWIKTLLLTAGVLFLLYMGWSTWNSNPGNSDTGEDASTFAPRKQIAFAASVSLLNPHAILDTVGVIGTSSLSYTGMEKVVFAASTILVSWVWFTGLALTGRIAGKLDKSGRFMFILNKVSAIIIWGAAGYILFGGRGPGAVT
ncbi:LysE/ArgO family amino acid transporter [Effusibacillus lacus]|uniref:Lysine transporter LysE n=1 Tax=Effusibacillus lacus TaxID=1348429 RepID=A0A292YCI4_9BACL|nr:LysE/ArgO family amino acid transporter [Effusibacillus lacus]TCS69415.1 L-lysine exporter family protein LysE/ArgO [Effusibacillus lacus]GAX89182.1 lysine transporter LysE [Effusibacillus lacus]